MNEEHAEETPCGNGPCVPELAPFVAVVLVPVSPAQNARPLRFVSLYSLCTNRFLFRHVKKNDNTYKAVLVHEPDGDDSA